MHAPTGPAQDWHLALLARPSPPAFFFARPSPPITTYALPGAPGRARAGAFSDVAHGTPTELQLLAADVNTAAVCHDARRALRAGAPVTSAACSVMLRVGGSLAAALGGLVFEHARCGIPQPGAVEAGSACIPGMGLGGGGMPISGSGGLQGLGGGLFNMYAMQLRTSTWQVKPSNLHRLLHSLVAQHRAELHAAADAIAADLLQGPAAPSAGPGGGSGGGDFAQSLSAAFGCRPLAGLLGGYPLGMQELHDTPPQVRGDVEALAWGAPFRCARAPQGQPSC